MLLPIALAAAVLAAPGLDAGTQLSYAGTMAPVKDDGNPSTKEFELTYIVLADGAATETAWTIGESGRGGWTWLDRFGQTAWPQGDADSGPSLLYERAEGRSIVPLVGPVFSAAAPLAAGAMWEEGRLEYRVTRETNKAGRSCWEIDVRSPYGHKRTLWVERDSALVVAVRERVFIGQGEEHRLTLELTASQRLSADELQQAAEALAAWQQLRRELAWPARNLRRELSDEQLATLKAELPKLASAAAGPFAEIAQAAQRETQGQRSRAGAVAALGEQAVGQPLGEWKLDELSGRAVAPADVAGKVVVLHFWEYRDAPLEEPYGQVGYLDYLARRRADDGVVVLGVNVDERLADEGTRRAAIASARKLKAFMNVSYPILLDDGRLLKRLGDPRPGGGKLPLVIVVGKDGKIANYHAGLYDVKANEGLIELSAAIDKAAAGK